MSITDFPVEKAAREIAKISLHYCNSREKNINDLAKKIEKYLIQEIINTGLGFNK